MLYHMTTDVSYISGYIDGDGCFSIAKGYYPHLKYRAEIIVISTSEPLIDHFYKSFGGSKSKDVNRPIGHKPILRWSITHENALEFSKLIFPYLVERKHQCLIWQSYFVEDGRETAYQNMKEYRESMENVSQCTLEAIRNVPFKGISVESDWAYLAGFIDAECSLGISTYKPKNKPNPTFKIILQCNNANPTIFYWLMEKLGGSLALIQRTNKNPKHRNQITWRLSGKALSSILPKILPYLKAKKPVCQKLMEFYETTLPNGGDRHSTEFQMAYADVMSRREVIIQEIHKLNSKGTTNV